MKIEYHHDVDMLHIGFIEGSYEALGGQDTHDLDVVLHFDHEHRLAEIEISNASKRVDLEALRKPVVFEEVRPGHSASAA